jgi:chorismate dehydratase
MATMAGKPRIGAVSYLNTKPLIWNLSRLAPGASVEMDYPSRLADRLVAGQLDVALIPSIELSRNPQFSIISDACIACRGPVLSVKLFLRVPPAEVKTLALDEGSRTSAALAQILLAEQYQVWPQLLPLPVEATLQDTAADAVLLIGDRAMHSPAGRFAQVWDLGDIWCKTTGLPFVFAMWVARPEFELGNLEQAISQARDEGLLHLAEIAHKEAAPLGLTVPQCQSYLRDNLYFHLGSRELEGLHRFIERAGQLGLCPKGVELGSSH